MSLLESSSLTDTGVRVVKHRRIFGSSRLGRSISNAGHILLNLKTDVREEQPPVRRSETVPEEPAPDEALMNGEVSGEQRATSPACRDGLPDDQPAHYALSIEESLVAEPAHLSLV